MGHLINFGLGWAVGGGEGEGRIRQVKMAWALICTWPSIYGDSWSVAAEEFLRKCIATA